MFCLYNTNSSLSNLYSFVTHNPPFFFYQILYSFWWIENMVVSKSLFLSLLYFVLNSENTITSFSSISLLFLLLSYFFFSQLIDTICDEEELCIKVNWFINWCILIRDTELFGSCSLVDRKAVRNSLFVVLYHFLSALLLENLFERLCSEHVVFLRIFGFVSFAL